MTRFLTVSAALLLALPAAAQELQLPDLSPRAEVMQTVGITHITVNYASPGKKGRKIYGELVPFGKLWRTGANSATTLELSNPVKIGGKEVPAGKYAVFTIPGEKKWTLIINKNPNQGGTRNYDEKLDVLRTEVVPEKAPERERMTFLFADTKDDSTVLMLEWAGTRVRIPIAIDTVKMAKANVKSFAQKSSRELAGAARYMADTVKDLDAALALIDQSLAVDQTWFNTFLKADIHAKRGEFKKAVPLAEKAHEMGKKADYFFWKDRVESSLKEWKGKI